MSAVATNATGTRDPDGAGLDGAGLDGAGLDGVRHALAALRLSGRAPACCTWTCAVVVSEVRGRHRGAPVRRADPAADPEVAALRFLDPDLPDPEFEAVLARRFAHRYLKVVTDAQAGRPVPAAWRFLLGPNPQPPTPLSPTPLPPARLALAGVGTLLDYDLTLALVGAATVLGRTLGSREREAHGRVAAVLGTCVRTLVRYGGDVAETALAAGLDSPARRETAWRRAEHLWTLRGRPAEAEAARDALDREVRDSTARLPADGGPGVGRTVGHGTAG